MQRRRGQPRARAPPAPTPAETQSNPASTRTTTRSRRRERGESYGAPLHSHLLTPSRFRTLRPGLRAVQFVRSSRSQQSTRAHSAPRGADGGVSGRSSRRKPIRACSSSRKRTQSARRSSDTNSPGSSGSGEGDDSAFRLGPDFIPHLGVETVDTSVMEPQMPARTSQADPATLRPLVRLWGH
jgi:hypothetical protein